MSDQAIPGDSQPLSTRERWLYGGIGAMAPVAVAALTLDFVKIFSGFTWIVFAAWAVRTLLLFIVGGFVAYMHRKESDSWRCFITGISAPALITTAFAGSAAQPAIQPRVDASLLVSSAYASDLGGDLAKRIRIVPVEGFKESGFEQFTRGFFGQSPVSGFVIPGSYKSLADAVAVAGAVAALNRCLRNGLTAEPAYWAQKMGWPQDDASSGPGEMVVIESDGGRLYSPAVMIADPGLRQTYFAALRGYAPEAVQVQSQSWDTAAQLTGFLSEVKDSGFGDANLAATIAMREPKCQ